MKRIVPLLLMMFIFCYANCNKDKIDSNGLPAATQEGKNTFGFLLNGQPWTPKGSNGTSNLSLSYDAAFSGGVFNLSAFRNVSNTNGNRQGLTMYGDLIQGPEKIILPNPTKFGFSFWNEATGCTYDTFEPSTTLISGYFDLKKLDKVNHIFSGEFELKFKKTGCDELQISQGRFDMKY